jgi:hypothetical protein
VRFPEGMERVDHRRRKAIACHSLAERPDSRLAAEHEVRTAFFVVEPKRDQLITLAELVDQGRLRAEVMDVFDLASARDAFETGLRDHVRGKLVVRVVPDEAAERRVVA